MDITIQSLHFTAREPLTELINSKVEKLSRLNSKIQAAEVTLSLDHAGGDGNKVCEIRLVVPGNDVFAKRQRDSFEAALAEVVDALEHQLRK